MTDKAYIVSRTLETKIAIAENNDQNTLIVTLDVLKEILSLLKKQEAATVILINGFGSRVGAWCPNCQSRLHYEHDQSFCGKCGQAVKWE